MPLSLDNLKHGIVAVVADKGQHSLSETERSSVPLGGVDGIPLGLLVSLPHSTQLSLHVFTMEQVPEQQLVFCDGFPGNYQ